MSSVRQKLRQRIVLQRTDKRAEKRGRLFSTRLFVVGCRLVDRVRRVGTYQGTGDQECGQTVKLRQ